MQAKAINGGPQMVEVSRDGRRVYLTNSLYSSWDEQFYPEGVRGWMAKLDVDGNGGGMRLDPNFFLEFDGLRLTRFISRAETPRRIPTATRGDLCKSTTCYPSPPSCCSALFMA